MSRRLAVLMVVVACSAAASAVSAQSPKEVEGLMVVPGPGPAVQSTYPAPGGTVPAGTLILKIVFNQPMEPRAWSYGRSAAGDFPDCLADPRLLNDQRTYVLLCKVAPNRSYAIEINPAPRFESSYGRSAQPYTLKFTTSDADVTRSLHVALQQAGLGDNDSPIMTWRDPGQGVSQSPPT
jgi:hypothetical protein